MKYSFSWLLVLFLATGCARAEAPNTFMLGTLKVAVWLPAEPAGAPVILFSHGFHGCATQSKFLMQAFKDAGYAVFAPNHKDATCEGGASSWLTRSEAPFRKPDTWTAESYADRRDDMRELLDKLPADPRYRALDWNHVGVAGHSLGGYTVLGLGGAWPEWKDARIKAVLALSPFSEPFVVKHTLAGIDVPVMYQGGTRDTNITPGVIRKDGAYDQTPSPKYFVEFDGAGHFGWTDLLSSYHDSIDAYSIAFFDTVLKGKPFPAALRQPGKNIYTVIVNP